MLRIARDLVVTDGRIAAVTDVATRRPCSDPADRSAIAALVFALVRAVKSALPPIVMRSSFTALSTARSSCSP